MDRKALSQKVMVLGIDGMDPRFSKRLLKQGRMPNLQKLIEKGAARSDLRMMGNVPTITPPMWTTMATGATPSTHGVTCFWRQVKDPLDQIEYNLDSRDCKAEQSWNCIAEAGYKTLVWHWPGASWPPTSDSPNLHVVDGTNPGSVNTGIAVVDNERVIVANEEVKEYKYRTQIPIQTGAGCIMNDLETEDEEEKGETIAEKALKSGTITNLILEHADGEGAVEDLSTDMAITPLKPATGWVNAPEGAKEFSYYASKGLVHRVGLVCKNQEGIYDTIKIYKSKKDEAPICILQDNKPAYSVMEQYPHNDKTVTACRGYYVIEIDPNGKDVKFFTTNALDISRDDLFHPSRLLKEIGENVGYPPTFTSSNGKNIVFAEKAMVPVWDYVGQWQAEAIMYLIEAEGYQVVFSHLHSCDAFGHNLALWAKNRKRFPGGNAEEYLRVYENAYVDTDNYIGKYLPLLDQGWTILLVSDHGILISDEEEPPFLGDPFGVNVRVMQELGYTVLKTDANGKEIAEIDWTKTRAVASRGNQIWINLKGRQSHGIVDEADKYELERQIITDLYNYKDKETGKRIVSMVIRNKEAEFMGFSGEEVGDIVYWVEEGFNRGHGDSFSTCIGLNDSSVSPIFVACGSGIKENYTCERMIRQTDVAPTVCALLGVRFPKNSEGSVVHQILTKEF